MRSLRLAVLAGAASIAPSALAQDITLFGASYSVVRLDYAAQIQLPNIPFPNDPPVPFIESEGLHWVGGNRLLITADDISDIGFGMPDNWIVEITLAESAGNITAIQSFRQILAQDSNVVGYDLNPSGLSVNSGKTGFAAGANIVVSFGDGRLYGFSYQPGSEGQQLEFPIGAGCLSTPADCYLDLSSQNTNTEDVTYVPAAGGQFYAINQDAQRIERWDASTGMFVSAFPMGSAADPASPGLIAKGVTYVPDSPALPASLRRPDGIIILCFDDSFPALQAFDLAGNLIVTQPLTNDGTPSGTPVLDIAGCPGGLQLESLAADPATGRLFLSNQGSLTQCNSLYVLTPASSACPADFNADDVVNSQDFFDFLAAFFAQHPDADFNTDSTVNSQDFFDFLSAFFTPC